MCSKLTIKRDQKDVNGVFVVTFIVNFTYSSVFFVNLNIYHILQNVKYAEVRALYWKKERKVISLTDCKSKCFSSRI